MKRTVYETVPQRKNGMRFQFARNLQNQWFTRTKPTGKVIYKWIRYNPNRQPPIENCAAVILDVKLPGDDR